MKKYFKLQAKKSLSLLMAVIMLMTCWVWVAPEKAAAADSPEEGYYFVEIRGNLTDWEDDANVAKNDWIISHSDGSTTTFKGTSVYNNGSNKDNYVLASGWVSKFPTGIKNVYQKGCGGDKWRIEKPTAYVGNGAGHSVAIGGRTDGYNAEQTSETTVVLDMYAGITPVVTSIATSSATATVAGETNDTYEVKTMPTVPKIGSGEEQKISCSGAYVYDQYKVRMTSENVSYSVMDSLGSAEYKKDTHGVWANGSTVYANEDVQIKMTNLNGSEKVYLYGTNGEIKRKLAEITLNYPQYEVTVDHNGSISNLGATMDMSDGSTRTTAWSDTGYYSASVVAWPKGGMSDDGKYLGANKAGYTFKGFWTTKQPTSGAANYDASEADFANPTDSTTFDTYKAQEGAVLSENNLVVTLADGSKHYNAGRQWDAAKDKEVLGNATFYGWWISQDITVKFYDIDGTYLGTQNAKYGSTPAEDWYPDPKDSYNAGAFEYQTFAKKWRDITGVEIIEGSYTFGPLDSLSLTPIYETKTYSDKYQVNFVNPADGTNIDGNNENTETNGVASGKYDYRHILSGDNIPTVGVPGAIVYDSGYTYEFSGWSSQKPASGYYHTVAKDDTSFVENTDWVVRDDITYYAVFRSTVKEYVIAFNYTDTTGTAKTEIKHIPYGSVITTPSNVNRTYATGGYGYTLEGWGYVDNDSQTVMLGVDATLVFNAENVFLTAENLAGATPEKPIVFTANYDEGQPTPYTVTFKYKDAKGVDKTVIDQVYHGYKITQGTVDKLDVPAQYDDGEALYTFANKWIVTEGTADKAEYTADEFTSFSPTSHVTFEAVYGEGVPFYTVTYIDGFKTYSERILAGSNVPAWLVDSGEDNENGEPVMEEYAPAKGKTETGEYKFEGWFDEEQTDKNFAQTNGTEYTTESIVNGDLVLYPQFTFSPFKFTIKFMNFDGTAVLAEGEYEAGENFKDIYDAALAKTDRPADEIYSYSFIGWDYKVPETLLCEGKDMTYTAQYRPNYIYYKARWYNDVDAMKDPATPEMEKVGEDGLLAITNHTYEGAVYAPSVDLVLPTNAPEGESYVFAGWKYLKDGVETDYVRGMTITSDINFYATYTTVKNAVTVTTIVDGEPTEYKVEYGETAAAIGTPVDGYKDENQHSKFVGWYEDESCETAFDVAETAITENITIYAKFDLANHSKTLKELVSAPTYYKAGSEKIWCSCSKEDTLEEVEIDMLTDEVAPTGTIYLGTQGAWSSTDEVGAAATDNDEVAFFANADTDIILTINDTGDVDTAYNPSGVGKGIANIQGIISTGVFGADTTEIAGIQNIFTDASETLNNTANYVIRLGTYEGLIDGETYIAYYYAKDKAGNELNKNVRTAKFIYDITAPDITIDGDSNDAETTYCAKATVTDIEEGATVTVNGQVVSYADSKYEIAAAGNYIITVTDKAGNTASKKIIVADGHDEVTTTKAVTCTEDGYEKVTCAVCEKVIKNEIIESEGHKYGDEVEVEPTCTEAGYTVKTCSVCGHEVVTEGDEATGHNYNKDENNEIVYEVVTPSTCKVKGKAEATCTVCDEGKLEKELELDTENGHKYGAVKVLKATCDKDGEKYQTCKYCFEKETVEVLLKLNHVDTGRYTKVTTAATCYSEGVETEYCKACDTVMGTKPIEKIAHTLVLVKYEGEDNDDVENYPNGYMQYECKAAGCTHTEGKTAINVKATYTVTFKGAGENGTDVVITKTEGESINAAAVADQTKEADVEYEYKFAGWKGSDGKVVKLPITVTKNETYTAEFTSTKITYRHIFTVDDAAKATFATIVGVYGDTNKKPVAVPTKAGTTTITYEFAGWANIEDTNREIVTDFTMTSDATFIAVFTAVPVKYSVIFYSDGEPISTAIVDGGNKATAPETNPTKAPDADGHYEFAGWYSSAEYAKAAGDEGKFDFANTAITATTRIYAGFAAAEHDFSVIERDEKGNLVTWAATCIKAGQTTEKCSDCGYEKVTAVDMTDHVYGEPDEDGIKHCTTEGCDAKIEPEAKEFNITFAEKVTYYGVDGKTEVEETEDTIKTSEKTKTYAENAKVELTAADKADTAKYTVEFIGWTDANGDAVDTAADIIATSNATYTANYTATWRTYKVIYLDAERVTIKHFDVAYGDVVPAIDDEPEKAYTDDAHYIFDGWTVEAGTTVTKEYQIVPVYKAESHDMVKQPATDGENDCEKEGVDTYKCACGCTKTVGTATKKHKFTVEEKAATYDEAGYINKTCKECGKVENTVIPKLELKTLKITVVKDGALVADAKVTIYTTTEEWPSKATGMSSGTVEFSELKHATYTILVTKDGASAQKDVVIKADETVKEVTVDMTADNNSGNNGGGSNVPSCSCSCHRPGFWGLVFRFFHKIISFFTGRVNCCADPQTI